MTITGSFLLVTALFLVAGHFVRKGTKEITYGGAFLMGIAQALAVFPGLSRSGTTISTGLILGIPQGRAYEVFFPDGDCAYSWSKCFMEVITTETGAVDVVIFPLVIAFVTAFVSGYFACRWMIKIVSRGKLIWFAVYCLILGLSLIFFA